MIPTEQWLRGCFALYNQKYFKNALQTPNFKVQKPCYVGSTEAFGGYYYDVETVFGRVTSVNSPGTIVMTGSWDRSPKSVSETLLHEMIHMYIYTVMKKFPRNPHNEDFVAYVRYLNGMGWNVPINKTQQTETDIELNESEIREMVTECVRRILAEVQKKNAS